MDPKVPNTIRVAFVVEGSRGSIQPYLAVALRMQARGNVVKIFTNIDHKQFCDSFDIPTEGLFYNFSHALEKEEIREAITDGSASNISKSLKKIRFSNMPNDLKNLWPALVSFQPTILISGNPTTKALVYSFEKTIPLVCLNLRAMLPCSDKAPSGLPNLPFNTNKLWFKLLLYGAGSSLGEVKKIVKESLDINMDGKLEEPIINTLLNDIPSFPGPCCYGFSTIVCPLHHEWPTENFYPCGFLTIDKQKQESFMKDKSKGKEFGSDTNAYLIEFLSAPGTRPPVYLGWGPMMCKSPEWMVALAVEALYHAEERGILLGGWASLGQHHVPDHLKEFCKENVLFVSSAPHEWLFPQCSCIVHHGGSGTTAASVRSGRPTVITPVMGYQFGFADRMNDIGCGIGLKQMSSVTSTVLGDAINKCIKEEGIINCAKETGTKLLAEDGCTNFCQVFDDWLVDTYTSGEWHKKQEALLKKCDEHWKAEQEKQNSSSCLIS